MPQKKKSYHEGSILRTEEDYSVYSKQLSNKHSRQIAVELESIKYFNNKYYLGYFLLQVLVIEEHIRKLLYRIGSVLEREGKKMEKDGKSKLIKVSDLQGLSLGDLISCLKNYVDSEYLFLNKEMVLDGAKINGIGLEKDLLPLRNDIAHRLIYKEVDISILEKQIVSMYPRETILKIVRILSAIGLELSQREGSSDYFKIRKSLERLSPSKVELFRLKEF